MKNAFKGEEIQEDEYLFAISVRNATEVRNCIEIISKLGIKFTAGKEESDDFVVVAKEGAWWKPAWLIHNSEGSWFVADVHAPSK